MPLDTTDSLASLDVRSRRARPATRIAIGAAVVIFIAAVGISALVSLAAPGGASSGVVDSSSTPTGETGPHDPPGDAGATTSGIDGSTQALYVHVLGEVAVPGIVELRAGARVVDAVAAAGGLNDTAEPASVNLARQVIDGEQIHVLAIGELPEPIDAAAGGAHASGGAATSGGLVSLNSGSLADLDTLPRIGPALAQRIIDWRTANGGFTSVEQLLEVAGIGDAVFEGLAERVTL